MTSATKTTIEMMKMNGSAMQMPETVGCLRRRRFVLSF